MEIGRYAQKEKMPLTDVLSAHSMSNRKASKKLVKAIKKGYKSAGKG